MRLPAMLLCQRRSLQSMRCQHRHRSLALGVMGLEGVGLAGDLQEGGWAGAGEEEGCSSQHIAAHNTSVRPRQVCCVVHTSALQLVFLLALELSTCICISCRSAPWSASCKRMHRCLHLTTWCVQANTLLPSCIQGSKSACKQI